MPSRSQGCMYFPTHPYQWRLQDMFFRGWGLTLYIHIFQGAKMSLFSYSFAFCVWNIFVFGGLLRGLTSAIGGYYSPPSHPLEPPLTPTCSWTWEAALLLPSGELTDRLTLIPYVHTINLLASCCSFIKQETDFVNESNFLWICFWLYVCVVAMVTELTVVVTNCYVINRCQDRQGVWIDFKHALHTN